MPLSTMGPSQLARKNARSSHERNRPELASCNHPTPSANACRACSSPAARRARNASMSSGNAGRSSGRGGNCCRRMNTGSDVPTCTPMPAAKGRYVVSRSCGRQPSKNVSSVTTSAVKPAALARRRTDSVTSLLRGLFVWVSGKREWGEKKREGGREESAECLPIKFEPAVSVAICLSHCLDGTRARSRHYEWYANACCCTRRGELTIFMQDTLHAQGGYDHG